MQQGDRTNAFGRFGDERGESLPSERGQYSRGSLNRGSSGGGGLEAVFMVVEAEAEAVFMVVEAEAAVAAAGKDFYLAKTASSGQ